MDNKRIIGLAGVKGVGKTTWAKKRVSCTPNSTRMSFADSLKDLICELLNITREELEVYKNKEHAMTRLQYNFNNWCAIISNRVGCDESFVLSKIKEKKLFNSIRDLLQWVGTDVIREFDSNWHVNALKTKIENSNAETIFVDDVRFPNEKKFIEELGGFCFYLTRASITPNATDTHASENSLTVDMFPKGAVIEVDELENPDDDDSFDSKYLSAIF